MKQDHKGMLVAMQGIESDVEERLTKKDPIVDKPCRKFIVILR